MLFRFNIFIHIYTKWLQPTTMWSAPMHIGSLHCCGTTLQLCVGWHGSTRFMSNQLRWKLPPPSAFNPPTNRSTDDVCGHIPKPLSMWQSSTSCLATTPRASKSWGCLPLWPECNLAPPPQTVILLDALCKRHVAITIVVLDCCDLGNTSSHSPPS